MDRQRQFNGGLCCCGLRLIFMFGWPANEQIMTHDDLYLNYTLISNNDYSVDAKIRNYLTLPSSKILTLL